MMADHSTVAPVDDRVIHLTTELAIAPGDAFRHFIEPSLLTSWLTIAADVEARVGGRYELYWDPADRENNSTIGCRITALHDGELVAFQWRSPAQFKHFANAADPLTHVVVTFHAAGTGARMHLLHSGWRATEEWERARRWQEQAWSGALEKLRSMAEQVS